MIYKLTKKRYIHKITTGYYCQKISECAKKHQTVNTIGAKICRK